MCSAAQTKPPNFVRAVWDPRPQLKMTKFRLMTFPSSELRFLPPSIVHQSSFVVGSSIPNSPLPTPNSAFAVPPFSTVYDPFSHRLFPVFHRFLGFPKTAKHGQMRQPTFPIFQLTFRFPNSPFPTPCLCGSAVQPRIDINLSIPTYPAPHHIAN